MITDRNRRRLAKRTMMGRAAALRRGRASQLPGRPELDEVFRLDDDGNGQPLFFDVKALRTWCRSNLETVSLAVEQSRAQFLVESGRVDLDHIMAHTVRHQPEPVIMCRHAGGPNEDAIVDGAHRYVAVAMGAAMVSTKTLGYHAYVLEPDQWRPFVMSAARLTEIAAVNARP